MRRDRTDRRLSERLAVSFFASLIFHAVLVALLFAVATSSSEQVSPESVQGSEILEIHSRALTPATHAKPAVAPAPHALRIAKAQSGSQPPASKRPRVLHLLAKFAPTAPPNPTPMPVASAQPNPAPTEHAAQSPPLPDIAAVPRSLPSVAAIDVRVKALASVAPSASPAPSAAPATIAPAYAVERPHPATTIAPMAPHVAVAQPTPGAPNPGPTALPRAPDQQHGKSEQPGPKAAASPGRSSVTVKRPAPSRPVEVRSVPTPHPRGAGAPVKRRAPDSDLNARLRALIPTSPVVTTKRHFDGNVSAIGRDVEPTPPPEILARTKYVYEESGRRTGTEARIKMYVTSVRRVAGVTFCTGWLLRYPITGRSSYGDLTSRPNDPRYPGTSEQARSTAIVEENVTYLCGGKLTPFKQ